MKIITTSDWHLGNLFHGNDRLPEHKHFLQWLLARLKEEQPDALLIAGDVFDNGNPSAASQSAYYEFLADATQQQPDLQIIITAGNHDSASRLEAPRVLLARHKVQIRGNVHRNYIQTPDGGTWVVDYDDLIIPIISQTGEKAIVLAVPFLRNDVVQNASYSVGVNKFLRELTDYARAQYPGLPLIMMVHMYAKGADIAQKDASEKIIIGGQEEVNMEGWTDHPDYLTCGHIHKRQHIWNTDWARYTGSVLPMSFAEVDYKHGVDVITIINDPDDAGQCSHPRISVRSLDYLPQHPLLTLPADDQQLSAKKVMALVRKTLDDRVDGALDDHFVYLVLKVKVEKLSNDEIKEIEDLVATKNAVLCKLQKVMPELEVTTSNGEEKFDSVDDILDRDPLMTLRETFMAKHNREMSAEQERMLKELIEGKGNSEK